MPITLGLWPLAGITTVGVTPDDVRDSMDAAIDSGITSFDTAFNYGHDGESDRLLGRYVRPDRERFRVIGKVGLRWTPDHKRLVDGRPETLFSDAETSLHRIGIEQFDVLMFHHPDPNVPIERSAEAMGKLQQRGLCRQVGVCNVDVDQLRRFAATTPCGAVQGPLNLIQHESLDTWIPLAASSGCEVQVYWTLMKGLLAGRIGRDHKFSAGDSRPNYAIFQGETRRQVHDILDAMKPIAQQCGKTIAQLSIGWTMSQPGVTTAVVGARRPEQVREVVAADRLDPEVVAAIDAARDRYLP